MFRVHTFLGGNLVMGCQSGQRQNWMHMREGLSDSRLHLGGITRQIGIILLETYPQHLDQELPDNFVINSSGPAHHKVHPQYKIAWRYYKRLAENSNYVFVFYEQPVRFKCC
jgi:hypothetical protein